MKNDLKTIGIPPFWMSAWLDAVDMTMRSVTAALLVTGAPVEVGGDDE